MKRERELFFEKETGNTDPKDLKPYWHSTPLEEQHRDEIGALSSPFTYGSGHSFSVSGPIFRPSGVERNRG